MSEFKLMSSIEATYKPQGNQTFRCSSNIPKWNTPKNGTLRFIVTVPPGYPEPIFAVTHDKVGADKRWYSHVSNGSQIDINSGAGGPGGHALYIGTTSDITNDLDGSKKYRVDIYVLDGEFVPPAPGYKRMSAVAAYYQPQKGQSFRCSNNFREWNTPAKGTIKFEVQVPNGYPQPEFAVTHDKTGADKRWYSDLFNDVEIDINSEDGGAGKHALYVGTTSKLHPGLVGSKQYLVYASVYENNTLPNPVISDDEKNNLTNKHAPYVYMDINEEYFPSTVEFTFPYVERYKHKDGNYWVRTKEKLKGPSDVLPYFSGDLTNAKVYAFWVCKKENIQEITYFFFYPYNRGKQVAGTVWGNHVGDWEHATIRIKPRFANGRWKLLPIVVYLSAHSGGSSRRWNDVALNNSSPIIFSAQGSHAMYFTEGKHKYNTIPPLIDLCSKGAKFDCTEPERVVAFDYSSKKGFNGEKWPSWMSDDFKAPGISPQDPSTGAIFRWGNPEDGCTAGQCRLENGPTGPISKGAVWDINKFE